MDEINKMVFLKLAKGQQDATLHLWQALVGVLLATGALRPDVLRAMLVYCADHVPTESPSQGILIRARQDLDAALAQQDTSGKPAWFRGVIDGDKGRSI